MNNPVLHTLSSSPFFAYLLTFSIVPSSSNGSLKPLYTLRIPGRARLTKFQRVCCFRLSTRVTGRLPIFRVIPTYEVLAYFMINNNNIKTSWLYNYYCSLVYMSESESQQITIAYSFPVCSSPTCVSFKDLTIIQMLKVANCTFDAYSLFVCIRVLAPAWQSKTNAASTHADWWCMCMLSGWQMLLVARL